MAWSYNPTPRGDLLLEVQDFAETGSYTSAWIETADVDTVRVAVKLNGSGGTPYVAIQEALYAPIQSYPEQAICCETAIPITSRIASGEVKVTGRWIRLILTGGPTDNSNNIMVRSV